MPPVFLDANVLIRHLTGDNPDLSPRATAYLERIERREVQVRLSETVLFETVFTLQRQYRQRPEAIRDALLPLLNLRAVLLPGKRRLRRAFALYVDHRLPFGDACHAALMESLGLDTIVSFDREFDRVPGITRVEP